MSKEIIEVSGGNSEHGTGAAASSRRRWKGRIVGLMNLFARILALSATLSAIIAMATTDQTLSVFTRFFQFEAKYSDISAFEYFVVANTVAGGYLVVSLVISAWNVVRLAGQGVTRLLLVALDSAMACLQTSAAAAATAMAYLAHNGNSHANWFPICAQFDSFCKRTSGSLIASFVSVVLLIFLVMLSAFYLFRRTTIPQSFN